MNVMNQVLEESLPKKGTRSRYRVVLGLSMWATMGVVGVHSLAMFGELPRLGGVAWADDQDRKIDSKIQQAVDPIKQQVAQIERAVKEQAEISNTLLASVAASQIRATKARLCVERNPVERERLEGELQRYVMEYPKYTDGREFPVHLLSCRDS